MEQEMYNYTKEITDAFELRQESRIQEMRDRVKELKDKRHAEEQKLVQAKLNLLFE